MPAKKTDDTIDPKKHGVKVKVEENEPKPDTVHAKSEQFTDSTSEQSDSQDVDQQSENVQAEGYTSTLASDTHGHKESSNLDQTSLQSDVQQPQEELASEVAIDNPKEDYDQKLGSKHSCFKACFFWSFFAFLLGAALASGFFSWKGASTDVDDTPEVIEPSSTPTATSTPQPTFQAPGELDLSQFSVQVLNGSGIAGTAGDVATLLETAGFTSVSVGNADSTNYEQTEVSLSTEIDSTIFDSIKTALADYEVVKSSEAADGEFDIVIIVGSN